MKTMQQHIKLPSGYSLEHHEVLYSTNYEAIKLAQCGGNDGTIIISDKQIKGKGRNNRTWYSPQGNLYFSIIIRELSEVFHLPFISALSVGTTLEQILNKENNTNAKVQYKWPNDILVNSKKISGILLESNIEHNKSQEWVVIGIGVNIYHAPEYATTIQNNIPNISLSNLELLEKIIYNFDKLRKDYLNNGFSNIRNLWLKNTYHNFNDQITIQSCNNIYVGNFVTLDLNGSLVIEQDGQAVHITSGEIFNI
ncbi:biotin--[acetyl-CoA-carboxylase] ligase [Ehrlichia ruminantium]|uniref:biotin--[biotin carboxyl-carrier protein] ligase n=1 Tax=Ehrlichia ruminantium (strain Welgevonden) TaxID=254945 RepID=A0A0H3M5L0_EHRRW|nr:biotin--[acetyl-CoA-carboxylase] ligase [Ehrlichia ruminantium]KYW92250.1 biotin--[acetyl-CoA-carboxylase] ligase [Ehrlichia ruminantium]QLK53089.1 biotin--[acetyl-CoA-carboxylase] ligase [Ehrlichia ruminantium]QLK54927.1 biotin--[acetyl-CoA-carboxylase] ligase [Ehrlichia ruminantium]QLK55845.1 biotin--[acetyl-CoA-carboxylase] ligase [Ehrlichia ruminantium]QLK56760.1 biotin--[acetyl-CoA-carboxylase] ligase [Ehrlichia ruminantium]